MPQFTKNAIIDSFVGLLNKYPLNKISVKDIVDDCGINRSTFYYYFEDIYALLAELLETETQKVLNVSDSKFSWKDGFLQSTEFAKKNKSAIYHIYNSLSREYLDRYLYSVIEHVLKIVIKKELEGYNVKESDIQIMVDIYKFALVGMIYKWLQSGMKEEYTSIASRMYELIGDSMKNILIKTDSDYEVITTIVKKSDKTK